LADDLLTNIVLATRAPLVVAPAMNTAMLEHETTRAHLAALRARGVTIVEPGVGFLAEPSTAPAARRRRVARRGDRERAARTGDLAASAC